ncbi:hypothetical protein BDZ89DRAFT_960702, partial [Hymenopellis radicata]
PNDFHHCRKDQAEVQDVVRTKYPGNPIDLPNAWPDDNATVEYAIALPLAERDRQNGMISPLPTLAKRYHAFLSPKVQQGLLERFDGIMATKPKIAHKRDARSSTSALHIGIWECTARTPRLTADTRNQEPITIAAIDEFLAYFGAEVSHKIDNRLRFEFPEMYARALLAHERIRRRLRRPLQKRPMCDVGPSVFSIAMKEGSSEFIHLDFSDRPDYFCWVLPVGDWTGGEFCAPQLGVKFPIRPGQAFAVRARYLAHCSAPVHGRRVVFTCFVEGNLLTHAEEEALNRYGAIYV